MAIDGFTEIFNTVYIAKKLHDMGRYELVTGSFFDVLYIDVYYENMYSLIENLFRHHHCRYYENRNMELHVLSDPVIVDFYTLAGEYGRLRNIPDDANPHLKAAIQEMHQQLDFSYCLDWRLMGHTELNRVHRSRLALFMYQDDYVELGVLAYNLIELYEWFSLKCDELRNTLRVSAADEMGVLLCEGAMAA